MVANSAVPGPIVPNFELVPNIMVVLLTCKNEEDKIKNEGTRVLTRSYVIFSGAQGQIIPKSEVEFCRNSNSSNLLWLSSLPTRMKKIQSKMKALDCKQDFPHYKSMGLFQTLKGSPWSNHAEFRTRPRYYGSPPYLQE